MMTASYKPPSISDQLSQSYNDYVVASAEHVPTPSETDPILYELLPQSRDVPPFLELAGVAGTKPTTSHRSFLDVALTPHRTASAVYTPDGTAEWPLRTLMCRLIFFPEDDRPETIDQFHEAVIEDDRPGDDGFPFTDWIDAEFTETERQGQRRTAFRKRRPLLYERGQYDGGVSHPAFAFAYVLQSTRWGAIESALYLSPDPDPGMPLDIVESVADQCFNRAQRLPEPTIDLEWPEFTDRSFSRDDLLAALREYIADHSNGDGVESGQVLQEFIDEYDVESSLLHELLEELTERGDIHRPTAAHYKTT